MTEHLSGYRIRTAEHFDVAVDLDRINSEYILALSINGTLCDVGFFTPTIVTNYGIVTVRGKAPKGSNVLVKGTLDSEHKFMCKLWVYVNDRLLGTPELCGR